MSVSKVLVALLLMSIWAVSCVKDPDPSIHTAPEILNASMSVEGAAVRLRCGVSRGGTTSRAAVFISA